MQRPYTAPYLTYGAAHEKEIFKQFTQEIDSANYSNWLYNGMSKPSGQADLGYFMGYTICKYHYQNAADKTKALAEIIELDYTSNEAVRAFYRKTGYAKKKK